MIEIKGLKKKFGNQVILDDLNMTIPNGHVFALVGVNGCGKSTLLRLMSGVLTPDEGDILYDGVSVLKNYEIKKNIFFLPDDPYYAHDYTPRSITDLYKMFYNFDVAEYEKRLKIFNIPLDKSLGNFSKGMKRQVFVSLALSIKPKYLFLDEAFDGLDALGKIAFKRSIAKLIKENNTTVIISSHALRELEDLCDSYALIKDAKISDVGNIEESKVEYHKYQLAFDSNVKVYELDLNIVNYKENGRVIELVTSKSIDEFKESIKDLNPLFVEELPLNFEELFIFKANDRGEYND